MGAADSRHRQRRLHVPRARFQTKKKATPKRSPVKVWHYVAGDVDSAAAGVLYMPVAA